jgi:hypothetical protein
MKVKAGDRVFDSNRLPVMIILSQQDKENIAHMHPECMKYAAFPGGWGNKEEMLAWMDRPEEEETNDERWRRYLGKER